ncbi:hypothetical protein MBRA1_003059 [Malassezia brasiliensis]|uniref:Restriction endonuclease type IV Mrr domain-containing protein n=1 Tax=Malassezia brasiliensis TaxID=1821822 RepID=A0AAF0DVX1_9BASI|nr:hypothetical protein MBRA1_003059 [Malassezia brasiliensis]
MATLRGTAYEQACLSLLQRWLRMDVYRTGGAHDRGMDLCGWWSPHTLSSVHNQPGTRVRVVTQCKAIAKPAGPHVVRELEGTLVRAAWDKFAPNSTTPDALATQPHEAPLIGVLAVLSGFSKHAMLQARSSRIPMLLLHLTSPHSDFRDLHCAGFVWNEALAHGVLDNRFDIGWVERASRSPKDGVPQLVVYRDGIAVA